MEATKHWDGIVDRANATRKVLDDKPQHLRIGYDLRPGSILNAYREGDATFAEAVEAIQMVRGNEVERLRAMRAALVRLRNALGAGDAVAEQIDDVLALAPSVTVVTPSTGSATVLPCP